MLPPAVLSTSPHITESQKKSLETFSGVVAKNGAAATSLDAMQFALNDAGVDPKDMARVISDIANASVSHNNATRKYNLLGLPNQDGVKINFDPAGVNWGKRTEIDLTDMADVQLYLMDARSKNLRNKMWMP